ncbi:DNA mismatch repair protein MutT [Actinorhabdospora filicis]|uniref:DNA mismatch repair protein MutT n=1 Tax=Actinorhabdospora filicis TaxID=1785913 RepID=A0A9W6SG08_9ACTN|nr:NUDIX domain-containing protein [Actinorhabdospora filicis]GLZ75197.1 DNA mismatch repair protein MutT [Actinorhabdospora filicis]
MRSAGILLHRRGEVLLAHMGGPFWARKDAGAWTIPKGELAGGEEPWDAARREWVEELGVPVPEGPVRDLGEVTQKAGKVVRAFAIEGELDPSSITPGTFAMVWPPGSGVEREFPEVDRVAWFSPEEAAARMVAAQREFLARL